MLKLPVGIDNFEKLRKENFYYVDKTRLIEQILEQWGEVNLFTRPRVSVMKRGMIFWPMELLSARSGVKW